MFSFFGIAQKGGGGPCPNLLTLFPPCNCPLYLDINIMLCVYFLVIFNTKIIKKYQNYDHFPLVEIFVADGWAGRHQMYSKWSSRTQNYYCCIKLIFEISCDEKKASISTQKGFFCGDCGPLSEFFCTS